jgi:predicted permease
MIDDLRQAWRQIRQSPLVAIVVVLSLTIGIGVNTSVFSWVQARLLQPLPGVSGAASLRLVEPRNDNGLYVGSSWREYLDLSSRLSTLPNLVASRMVPLYVGEPGAVERMFGVLASDNYFSALGVQAQIGRTFLPSDVAADGQSPVVVISHGLWQSRYQAAPDVVGRQLRVNSQVMTIIGVAPEVFQGTVLGLNFDVWLPATMAPIVVSGSRELTSRTSRGYAVMGRLAAGVSQVDAEREVAAVMAALAHEYPESNTGVTAEVALFRDSPRGPQRMLTNALLVLQALMVLIWLAVCGNTTNLILARTSGRYREVSVRLALGASRLRICRLLLAESMVLSTVAALLGAGLAVWGTRVLMVLPMTGLPIRFQTELDAGGLLFALTLGVLSGLLVGIGPAWQLSRLDAQLVFRSSVKTSGRSGLRHALMAVQVALAIVVLVVAGLFVQSIRETRDTDPGFQRAGILLAAFDTSGRPSSQVGGRQMALRVLDELRGVPGVESAAISSSVPLDIHGLPTRVFTLDGRRRADGELDDVLSNVVTPAYFDTLGIRILAGRDFSPLTDESGPAQAVVNEAFVRTFVGSAEPVTSALGRTLEARGRDHVIVGVVATTLANAFGEAPEPQVYFSYRDGAPALGEVHVRTRPGAEMAVVKDVRRAVQVVDPEVPVFNVRTMTEHVDTNLVFRRVPGRLFVILGPLLLLLVAAGLYAVVSYATTLRTPEIGVRMALGASPGRLVRESVASAMRVVIAGAVVGWVIVFISVTALFPSGSGDLVAFVGVPLLLMLVAAVACWIPSRRCALVDPAISLRNE